jgi:hypothetical protein
MKQSISLAIRICLMTIASMLISKGILQEENQNAFVAYSETAIGAILALIPLFWTYGKERASQIREHVALQLPANSSTEDLQSAMGAIKQHLYFEHGFIGGLKKVLKHPATEELIKQIPIAGPVVSKTVNADNDKHEFLKAMVQEQYLRIKRLEREVFQEE